MCIHIPKSQRLYVHVPGVNAVLDSLLSVLSPPVPVVENILGALCPERKPRLRRLPHLITATSSLPLLLSGDAPLSVPVSRCSSLRRVTSSCSITAAPTMRRKLQEVPDPVKVLRELSPRLRRSRVVRGGNEQMIREILRCFSTFH